MAKAKSKRKSTGGKSPRVPLVRIGAKGSGGLLNRSRSHGASSMLHGVIGGGRSGGPIASHGQDYPRQNPVTARGLGDERARLQRMKDQADMEVDEGEYQHDDYCCFCHDGGSLVTCSQPKCPLVMCAGCVSFDGRSMDAFICPACWNVKVREAHKNHKPMRYPWTLLKSCTVRDFKTGVNTSPLLILEFTLSSLKSLASGSVFHEQLKLTYLDKPEDLCYLHIPFDNGDVDLELKRNEVVSSISSDDHYRRFKRVLIFVNSHTNEESLINHSTHGATDFHDFFNWLFADQLQDYLFDRSATMVLNCCGSYMNDEKQMDDIHRLTSRGIVKYIMSFVAAKFHPSLVVNLVTATLHDYYVSRKNFEYALERHLAGSDVGSHAHINVFSLEGWRTYVWGSDSSRPFGVPSAPMCRNCGLISMWQKGKDDGDGLTVNVRCSLCKKQSKTMKVPHDLSPIYDKTAQKWYVRKHSINA